MNRLEGKVALVAGGSKGIGYAISTTFAREGAAVAVVGSGLTAAQKTAQEILDFGGRAIAIGTDLTSGEGREAALEQTLNAFGKLDIIVNNAGWGCKKPLVETDEVSFDRSIALNLKATYFMTQIAAGALQGERNSSIYAATKAGIMALSRAAALELGPSGITINCVLPGFTRTNNNCHVPHTIDESFIPITPTGRVTVAQDIANACLFFAGEEAAQITAQCLPVDGGFSGTRAVQVAWNASMERK